MAAAFLLALAAIVELDRPPAPLLIAGITAQPQAAQIVSVYSTDAPPMRFRKDRSFRLEIMEPAELSKACGDPAFIACEGETIRGVRVIVPNPCGWSGEYAHILCHELGHVNGWPRLHGP